MINTVLKATPPIFRQIVVVLVVWTRWFADAPFISRQVSGYCVIAHSLIIGAAAVAIALGRAGAMQHLGKRATVSFSLSYALWAVADFCWAVNYFLTASSSKETLGIAVTLLCAASFALCSGAILFSIAGSIRAFFDGRITAIAFAVATAVILAMLFYPYLADPSQDPLSLFGVSEFLAIGTGYVLLTLAIVVLLASRTLEWSVYGAGTMCWVLGDSAIRIGKILNDSIDLDGYSVLCSFGLYASLLPLVSRRAKDRIDAVDFSSLFTSCKFGSTITIFLCLMAFLLSQSGDLNTVRLITLCCGLASFGSIFLSSFLVTKIKSLSSALGTVLEGDIDADPSAAPDVSELPLELREHYTYVFATAVRERKTKEWQRLLDNRHQMLRKVAHNILSPVAALNSQLADLAILPEECRIIMKTAIHDISDIAHSMSSAGASDTAPETPSLEPVLLSSVADSTASQKRIQYRSRVPVTIEARLKEPSYGLFANVCEADLRSVLSNLVNNAVEAIDDAGTVHISLRGEGDLCIITVTDDGRGIPAELLDKLGTQGLTIGKSGGAGIGLHHAKTCARAWGGDLGIESAVGAGTSVTLTLPRAAPPRWFVSRIHLREDTQVVVVDDNPAIHQVWGKRFAPARAASKSMPTIVHLSCVAELRHWHDTPRVDQPPRVLHLIDLEMLHDAENGIELIEGLGIASSSILVTSHYNDADVKAQCAALGLGLIPKSIAALVPISCEQPGQRQCSQLYDAVFVDNEELYRQVWQKSATDHGKAILVFSSITEFYAKCPAIDRSTPIFLDSDLGNGVAGEHEAKSISKDLGFQHIYLATAHAPSDFHPTPWLKAVVGKAPPWIEATARGRDVAQGERNNGSIN
jgi:signal transduction histidine kinase